MIIKECMAACDICGESFPDWKQDTALMVRVMMKVAGWKRIKGKDVCEECQKQEAHDDH